jgi:formate dehydrogenase maturation protein FdhE
VSALPVEAANPWPARRRRAEDLRARHSFAAEVLALYIALLDVQEDAWSAVAASPPDDLSSWAARRVLPAVVQATVAAGPPALREAAAARFADGTAAATLADWLAGAELDPVDLYLARASLAPALEALGGAWARLEDGDGVHCPRCGGRPQLGVLESTGDSLVSGKRSLLCARCAWSWPYTRSACAACGEADESCLVLYSEQWTRDELPVFPHLRIAGCTTCERYLIEVNLARDGRAVPEVDELAALPLDLYAADQGLTKVTPNLMGF